MKQLMENWRQYLKKEEPKEAALDDIEESSFFNSTFDYNTPHAAQAPRGSKGVEQQRQRKVEKWIKDVDANVKGTKFEAIFNAMRQKDPEAVKYFAKKYGAYANKMDSAQTAADAIRSVDLDTVMKTAQTKSITDLGMKKTWFTRNEKRAAVALVNDLSIKNKEPQPDVVPSPGSEIAQNDDGEKAASSELEDTIKENKK